MISTALVAVLRRGFALDWEGIHGVRHWARVRNNGLRLARTTGADPRVVACFAFLHDACRLSEGHDPDHGRRGAALARTLLGTHIQLPEREFRDLEAACIGHTDGLTGGGSATVLTCWDADRLDLGRVGIRPDPRRLCTAAARDPELLAWAWANSQEAA